MITKNKCAGCKCPLIVPIWKRCDDCQRKKKLAGQKKIRDKKAAYKKKYEQVINDQKELLKALGREIYGYK